jgi:cysteinyl-tRNA synthetase
MIDDVVGDHEGEERGMFRSALNLLGLLEATDTEWQAWRPAGTAIDEAWVERLIGERVAARSARDFAEADRLRGELEAAGIVLKDSAEGTTWSVKR